MANIVDELIRIKALNSKNEARMMIKNKAISVIPCICEDFEVPCFEVDESQDVEDWFEKEHPGTAVIDVKFEG